ncbi:MAG: YCF48-related protein [Candidatus Binataceae bacterium]
MQRTRVKFWALAGACLLMVAVGAISARGAIETPTQGLFKGNTLSSAPRWLSLFGVAMKPDGSIYIVGSKALLLISKDDGKSWHENEVRERPGGKLFQDRDLYSIRFTPDGKVAWICGEEGLILRSDDGGKSWALQKSGTEKNLFKLYVADAQNAYVVGADGTILRTTDGGQNWQTVKPPKNVSFFDITFTDKNTGWVVGEFSTVLETTDGGATWTVNYGGNTGDYTIGPWFSVYFTDPQNGIVAGLSGDLLITSDGGKTWQKAKLPDAVASYIVTQDPSNKKLWIGGNGGNMFDRNASGQWRSLERATFNDITDIVFAGNQGFAVGLNGTILRTKNAGEQWQVVQ